MLVDKIRLKDVLWWIFNLEVGVSPVMRAVAYQLWSSEVIIPSFRHMCTNKIVDKHPSKVPCLENTASYFGSEG